MYSHPTLPRLLIRALERTGRPVTGRVPDHPAGGGGGEERARPLETTPSRVGYAIYAAPAPGTPLADLIGTSADEAALGFPAAMGFPMAPVAAGTDRGGALFDTTEATVSDDGLVIGFRLQLGGLKRPYELRHVGGGTYRSVGCELTFEWTDNERFQHLDVLLDRGETYHVAVQDVVQLYETGGAFDWSVTRTDVSRDADADPMASLLTVVWDDDGPGNDAESGRLDRPAAATDQGSAFRLPTDGTPSVGGRTIEETAEVLMAAGADDGR